MSKGVNYMSNRHGKNKTDRGISDCREWTLGNIVPELTILFSAEQTVRFWEYPHSLFHHWCYYWNATEGAVIRTGDREISLTPDKAVLIPPFTGFATEMQKPFRHFYIHFFAEELEGRVKREIIELPGDLPAGVVPRITTAPFPLDSLLLRSLLAQVLAAIPAENILPSGAETTDPRIREVVDLMWRNISSPVDNKKLARKAGMGINAFYSLFTKEMNRTPGEYMLMLKMEQASVELLQSDTPIDQIAENCGYADRYHFSKAFRNYFGTAPGAFRKRHSKQPYCQSDNTAVITTKFSQNR